jgi:hypothetical protein
MKIFKRFKKVGKGIRAVARSKKTRKAVKLTAKVAVPLIMKGA